MLKGIRIVEFEGLGPGPFAAMHLADLGADVIVIHRATGGGNPSKGAANPLDRGKRSIALDLKDAGDRLLATRLATGADAIIEGFRPGVMERLGLGPDVLMAANPALVYGRMTGWGQSGPRASQAGHDLNYVATSGALWYAGAPDETPLGPATLLGDIGGGAMYLTVGILAGLLQARASGRGAVVDAAIVDGSAHMMALLMSLQANGALAEERGKSLLDGPHWSRAYRCADGGWFTVQALEPQFYATFLDRLGLSEAPEFASQYNPANWPAATRRLTEVFAGAPQSHWTEVFKGTDACAAAVLSPWQARSEPHIAARAIWGGEGALQPRPAPRFDGQVPPMPPPPPEHDAHRAEILKELET